MLGCWGPGAVGSSGGCGGIRGVGSRRCEDSWM